ncbi:retrovirus-related pol polyprotein from transposon TNT 1-94 [Tanacetum coccineum]
MLPPPEKFSGGCSDRDIKRFSSPDLPDPHHHAPPLATTVVTSIPPPSSTPSPSSSPHSRHHHLHIHLYSTAVPPPAPPKRLRLMVVQVHALESWTQAAQNIMGDGEKFKISEFCGKVFNVSVTQGYTTWKDLDTNKSPVGQFVIPDLVFPWNQIEYTITIDEMMKSSPKCLLSKASPSPKSWLLKFEKDHLCSACQLGKSKKFSHRPKSENTNMEVLHTLHMDLCGPMRVESIKGKKYILVIVDDYSRFTWVKFLRSKDETPEFVTNFLKQIQVGLNKTVRFIRTDNGTEFVNQALSAYYEGVGISHQKSVPRTPQQNGVVERRNRTLVEAARTMMIFSKAPMFLWAEAVATASRVITPKTPIRRRASRINTIELSIKMETIHRSRSNRQELEMLFQTDFERTTLHNLELIERTSATEILLKFPTNHLPVQLQEIPKKTPQSFMMYHIPHNNLVTGRSRYAQSSSGNVNAAEPIQVNYPPNHIRRWTKDHPLDNIVGNPSRPVSTRKQLASDALWCCFHTELSKVEPKNFKMAVIEDCWFQAMQDEIHEFDTT